MIPHRFNVADDLGAELDTSRLTSFKASRVSRRTIGSPNRSRSSWEAAEDVDDCDSSDDFSPTEGLRAMSMRSRGKREPNDGRRFQNNNHLRTRRRRTSVTPPPMLEDNNATSSGCSEDTEHLARITPQAESTHKASESNSSKRRLTKQRQTESFLAQPASSHENSQYIEYLESQLAATQTQLQSLTSPTSTRAQSAKLRALNAENKVLQQEVAGWEERFEERLRDCSDRHETVASHLRFRIMALERECVEKDQRQKETETLLEGKLRDAEAAERENRDLELRLEFMSSRAAASPSKLDLRDVARPEQRRTGKSRKYSEVLGEDHMSPSGSRFWATSPRLSQTIDSVLQASPDQNQIHRSPTRHDVAPDSAFDPSKDSGYSTERTTEPSESSSVLDDFPETSPTPKKRLSFMSALASTDCTKSTRRMRRFYGGSARQSLILPSTSGAIHSEPSSAADDQSPAAIAQSAPIGSVPCFEAAWSPEPNSYTDISLPSSPINDSTDVCQAERVNRQGRRSLFEELSKIKQESSKSRIASIDSTATLNAAAVESLPQKNLSYDLPLQCTPDQPPSTHFLNSPLFTEPAEDPDIETTFDNPPPAPSSPAPGQPLIHLPTSLRAFLISILHPISFRPHLTTTRQLIHHTWHTLVLSRPILESRIWLVRLLLPRLASLSFPPLQHRTLVGSAVQTRTSTGLGLGVAGARSRCASPHRRREGVLQAWQDPGIDQTPKAEGGKGAERGKIGRLKASGDEYGVDGVEDAGREESTVETPTRSRPSKKNGRAVSTSNQQCSPTAPGLGWFKLSATVLTAIGVALLDGPDALFDGECRECGGT